MDAERYRAGILECFEKLGKLGDDVKAGLVPLVQEAKAEKDPKKLFLMYQTIREVLAQDTKEKTTFFIETPHGVKVEAQNIAHGEEIVKTYTKRRKTGAR